MLEGKEKQSVLNRLNRIEGQVKGVRKMVEENRYCIDILNQTSAIASALRNVENIVMENHLNTCVAEAMRSNDDEIKREKSAEVMDVISKFRKHG
jgi:DNA-binding FrmR family transcriptional regulator